MTPTRFPAVAPSPLAYNRLVDCRACPRLADHLDWVRRQHPDYHCLPVGALGNPRARLLIVGLAPGRHGANRTGRPFTGDASGRFLFRSLALAGFASDEDPSKARLRGARITNAVRCLPPDNRPRAQELERCSGYLRHEIDRLWWPGVRRPRCLLALGRLAHDAIGRALATPLGAFAHGGAELLAPGLLLLASYHPSRQNTNTRRLRADMLDAVLAAARRHLEAHG